MKTGERILVVCILTAMSMATSRAASAEFTVDMASSAGQSLIVSNGQAVIFKFSSQVAKLVKAPTTAGIPRYQWVKDDILTTNETAMFTIPNVGFSDAGSYSVVFNAPHGRQESAVVYLSVYSSYTNHSNGGTLQVPIGQFASANNEVCGGTGFDKYKVYFPFYGPNAANQVAPFQNTSGSTNLDVSTCTNSNGGTLDTAVRIQENWLPMNIKDCNDDDGNCTNCTKLSTAKAVGLSTSSSGNNTYRATIYYNSKTLGNLTTVAFQWYYHN